MTFYDVTYKDEWNDYHTKQIWVDGDNNFGFFPRLEILERFEYETGFKKYKIISVNYSETAESRRRLEETSKYLEEIMKPAVYNPDDDYI